MGPEKCFTAGYCETTQFIALCEHLMPLITAQISHNSAPYLLAYGGGALLIESELHGTIPSMANLRIMIQYQVVGLVYFVPIDCI